LQRNKAAKYTFFSYFRSEFHFREKRFTVNRENLFLHQVALLSRLS